MPKLSMAQEGTNHASSLNGSMERPADIFGGRFFFVA